VSVLARVPIHALLAASLLVPVTDLDQAVRHQVQAGRRPWLEPVMHGASSVGRPTIVLGALLAFAVLGGGPGVALARTAIVAAVPTNVVVEVVKRATRRTRPDGSHDPDNASFPSSHAANAFALAVVLAARWRRGAVAFLLAAALVAFSRMYLDRHFLTDVLCGAAIGVVCGVLAVRWARRRGRAFVQRGLTPFHDGDRAV
jgi:membrane-associated phospholipid phosphatase